MTDDYDIIYRSSLRLKNGKRIFARHYGLTAFPIKVRRNPPKQLSLPGF